MDQKLVSFLEKYRITEANATYTHTTMAAPMGKYNIPDTALSEFHEIYCNAIENGGIATVTEKVWDTVPLIVDIDYKFDISNGIKRLYTPDIIRGLIGCYHKVIDDIVDNSQVKMEPRYKYCVLLEKPSPRTEKGFGKDGFHLHFPYFYAEPWVQLTTIRNRAIELVVERHVFDGIPFKVSIEKVFDANVPKNPWLMYGSRKAVNAEPYIATKFYNENLEMIPAKTFFKKIAAKLGQPSFDKKFMPVYMSIQHPDQQSVPLKYGAATRPKAKKRTSKTNENGLKKQIRSKRPLDVILQDLKNAEILMDMVSPERAFDHNQRTEIGWILFNIGEGNNKARDMWLEFCKHNVGNYDEAYRINQWNDMEMRGMTIGSLHRIAKEDSPKEYDQYKKDQLNDVIQQAGASKAHNDVAKVLYKKYEGQYICADPEKDIWYEFRDHRWHQVKKGLTLRIKMSGELVDDYNRVAKDYIEKSIQDPDPERKQTYAKRAGEYVSLVLKLKDHGFKNGVLKEAMEYFWDPLFIEKMDENRTLTVFENGVYDAKLKEFRAGRPEDYCTKSTHCYYITFEEDDPKIKEFENILEKIFVNPNLRKFYVQTTSDLFLGGNRHKAFYMWTGKSNNGKSVLAELLEKAFGDYHYTPPTSLLTGRSGQSGNATAELVPLKGARVAVTSETSGNETINEGVMKKLSGGDTFYARGLFRDPIRIIPQHKMIHHCNDLPNVNAYDMGTWNRIYVLLFESTFVSKDKAPKTVAEQFAQKLFPMDRSLKDRLNDFVEVFMWYMIREYEKYGESDLDVPDEVRDATSSYRKANDFYAQFIDEKIERTGNNHDTLSLTVIYGIFKSFYADSYPNQKNIPGRQEVGAAMEKMLGTPVQKIWHGVRLLSAFGDESTDTHYQDQEPDDVVE